MKFSNFYIKLLINYRACASVMREVIKINKEKSAKTALALTIGIALVFTAIATSLPIRFMKNGLDIKYNSSYGKISDALDQDGLHKDDLIHGKLR